ncbi:MAG: nucleotidyltransferase family protein [Anaerolineales bacterium]
MLTREKITELLRQSYPYLSSEFGVKRVGLFGSYQHGSANASSDIDLVVEFERPIGLRFVELAEYLEGLFGKPVEILTPAGIEGIRNPRVAQDIEKSIVYV